MCLVIDHTGLPLDMRSSIYVKRHFFLFKEPTMIEKKEGTALSPDAETLAQTCQYLESMTLQVCVNSKLQFSVNECQSYFNNKKEILPSGTVRSQINICKAC